MDSGVQIVLVPNLPHNLDRCETEPLTLVIRTGLRGWRLNMRIRDSSRPLTTVTDDS
jgi:hypothetical protein